MTQGIDSNILPTLISSKVKAAQKTTQRILKHIEEGAEFVGLAGVPGTVKADS